ncbi:hypothetical protein [Psychromonas sp.]|uniref:hypothetical protein n=1 Tax=Psychromonas sp. TaxID=1884585 RepID=UPI003A97E585
MALTFSNEIKAARLQAFCDALDANACVLRVFNAEQETVCELPVPSPSKLSIENGVLTLNNFDESMVLINATATNAAIIQDGNQLVSMNVGDVGSTADLKLPSTTLYSGSLLRLNGWTLTEL